MSGEPSAAKRASDPVTSDGQVPPHSPSDKPEGMNLLGPLKSLGSTLRSVLPFITRKSRFGPHCFDPATLENRYFAILAHPYTDFRPPAGHRDLTNLFDEFKYEFYLKDDLSNLDDVLATARRALLKINEEGWADLTWYGQPKLVSSNSSRPPRVQIGPDYSNVTRNNTSDWYGLHECLTALTWLFMDLAGPAAEKEWLDTIKYPDPWGGEYQAMRYVIRRPWKLCSDKVRRSWVQDCDLSHGKDWEEWGRQRMDLIALFFMLQSIRAMWDYEDNTTENTFTDRSYYQRDIRLEGAAILLVTKIKESFALTASGKESS